MSIVDLRTSRLSFTKFITRLIDSARLISALSTSTSPKIGSIATLEIHSVGVPRRPQCTKFSTPFADCLHRFSHLLQKKRGLNLDQVLLFIFRISPKAVC